jgi:MacB-like periplasmic core domain
MAMDFGDRLLQDLRYGLRMLILKRGLTAVAVLSVALGIGAATAIFSVVYAVLIDPYPYRAADRSGGLRINAKNHTWRGIDYSKAQYLDLKSRIRSMEDAVAVDSSEVVMTGTGLAEVVRREYCSPNFFDFFGVPPIIGRTFTVKNSRQSAAPDPIAVLSYKFWQRVFQGRPEVLGRKVLIPPDMFIIARTKGEADALIGPARNVVRAVDPNQPISLTRTLKGWLDTATAYPRFATFLFGAFGGIGLLLAAAALCSV